MLVKEVGLSGRIKSNPDNKQYMFTYNIKIGVVGVVI